MKKPNKGSVFLFALSFFHAIGPIALNSTRLYAYGSNPKCFLWSNLYPEVTYSTLPAYSLAAPLVVILIIPPVTSPYCAGTPPSITETCSMAD